MSDASGVQNLLLYALRASIFVFVLALGLRATPRDATYLLRRPEALFRAMLSMNGIMLAFVVVMVLLFDLRPAVRVALVALAVSPIPPILPRKALRAGGAEDYTIGLLVAAALASVVLIPLSMETLQGLFGVPLGISVITIASLAATTILLPVAMGIGLRHWRPSAAERIAGPLGTLAMGLLLIGLLIMLVSAHRAMLSLIGNGTILAFVAFTVVGLAVGHLLGRPEGDNRAVLALATATRHPGIAAAIVHANRPEEQLAPAAILLFFVVNIVVSGTYLVWNARLRVEAI